MPVVARGNAWQATLHHKGQRWRRDFATKAEADVWHAEGHAAILRGEAPVMPSRGAGGEDTPSTLQALLDRTAARYWRTAKAGPVLEANGQAVVDLLGRHLRPDQVTTGRVDALVEALRRKGNSNGTINRKLAALSRMMTFAADRGYIARKPKLERLQEAEGRLRWISDAEEAALLAFFLHIGDEDMHDYCVVALDTGMRAGELLGLRWAEITSMGVQLHASRTKGKRARLIPLTRRAAQAIAKRNGNPGPLVFRGMTQSHVTHAWNRARHHMGLTEDEEFVPHVMRHTFCSRLAMKGANAVTIQKLAGHSSLTVTQRYMHLAPKDLATGIALLEQTPDATRHNPVV